MIHPLADVQSSTIGENTTIWQFCVILKNAQIGKNCNINCNVFIENDVIVGDNVTIKPGVQLWDGVRIADNVHLGPNATFTNDKYPRSKEYVDRWPQITIGKYASIGANATILPGVSIGNYAKVGAGAVVTKEVLPHQVVVGNPAKVIGYSSIENNRVSLALLDEYGHRYKYENNILSKTS
ncbi:dTDP-6-deoxy-3,4-keto-hexulose isomerase [Nonlabens spongiae]|uniref:dTDP-6-deoxy-3,4-keto-hexulose isomerase n=1 Tax=Nonlabens spongiae TaxID=331648 RepID=A0A1W6MFZ3_9FLAO|nr:acyltransferase [Nonlabens spongiae]ARN76524.1 dTDP-6-deoxy-3,4-keto-hexulose isomerase [Nonlabens spongiae]